MTLCADVSTPEGLFLFPAGTGLTDRHLMILESWGVAEVDVTLPEGMVASLDPLAQLDAQTLERLGTELKGRFLQLEEEEPAAMEVFRVMLRREAARHIASGSPSA